MPKPRRLGDHRSRASSSSSSDSITRIASAPAIRASAHLAQIDEKILGEDRPVELSASRGEVVERAAEKGAVAKHAQRIGNAGIAARQRGRVGIRPDRACRRRRLLDLEDEARAWLSPAPRQGFARVGSACARRASSDTPSKRARKLLALGRGDLAEDADGSGTARLDEALEHLAGPARRERIAGHRPRLPAGRRAVPAVISSAAVLRMTISLFRRRPRPASSALRRAAFSSTSPPGHDLERRALEARRLPA